MERHLEPSMLRARVIDALAGLPPAEHLDVLRALDHGEIEIVLTDPATVQVVVHDDLTIEIPLRDVTVADD